MLQIVLPLVERLIVSKSLSLRVGAQVVKNVILGKQRSAILNKVKTPFIQALLEKQKFSKFRQMGGRSL